MMFKSLNESAPMYLRNLSNERSTNYDLCNSFCNLTLPRPCTDYLKRSFGYSGTFLRNSFSENFREIRSIGKTLLDIFTQFFFFFWTNFELFHQEIQLGNIMSKRVNHTKKFTDQGFSFIDLIPKKEKMHDTGHLHR